MSGVVEDHRGTTEASYIQQRPCPLQHDGGHVVTRRRRRIRALPGKEVREQLALVHVCLRTLSAVDVSSLTRLLNLLIDAVCDARVMAPSGKRSLTTLRSYAELVRAISTGKRRAVPDLNPGLVNALREERLGYRLGEPVPGNRATSPSTASLPARVGVAPTVKNSVPY
jgi:hypothetical protein